MKHESAGQLLGCAGLCGGWSTLGGRGSKAFSRLMSCNVGKRAIFNVISFYWLYRGSMITLTA